MPEEQHQQQKRIGVGMVIAAWIGVLLLASLYFGKVLDRQHNPNQQLLTHGDNAPVVLKRNKFGHYVASGSVNGQPVVFMLDTGASDVSIPAHLASRLELRRGPATTYDTANGRIEAYRTTLAEVRLGDIVLRNVAASINPGMQDDELLLGMSFLKHLEFTQRGDTLTLRQ